MFLRRLNLELATDRAIANGLFLATPNYEFDTFGRLPSASSSVPLAARFPEECKHEDRLTIAAFEHEDPVGLIQVALHLPSSDCAALLLLVVPKHLQQRHLGCEIVNRLSRQARRWSGIARWHVSVVQSNTAALAFWRHCGFRTTTQDLNCAGFGDRLSVMTRAVKAKPACHHSGRTENLNAVIGQNIFARLG